MWEVIGRRRQERKSPEREEEGGGRGREGGEVEGSSGAMKIRVGGTG